jgi:hypothetical protein
MAGIFGWELVKLVLCIAMLAAAPSWYRPELAGVAGRLDCCDENVLGCTAGAIQCPKN